MQLVINGQQKAFDHVSSLDELLQRLDLDPRMVVVELNRAIVRRPNLAATSVREGDRIELVHFVGGG